MKSKDEITKLRNELFMNNETDRGQRPESSAQNDQGQRNQGRGRGSQSRGGRGRGYFGPRGSAQHPNPGEIPHIPGGGAKFDENSSSNRMFTDQQGRTPSQRQAEKENGATNNTEEDVGWFDEDAADPRVHNEKKKGKNKKKGKKPETVPLTKRQLRFAKEVIIHKVRSQVKGSYKDEEDYKDKEAKILFDVLEELSPKYLGDHGVAVDIKKDIDYHDRFMNHNDEKEHGMAPIRLRFFTVKMCSQVLKAAKRAECLKGRRPSFFGKYAIPRKYDKEGNFNASAEEEAKEIAASRPAFYFRPSIPEEDRKQKEVERKEREEKKKDPNTIRFKELRKESLNLRVKYGKSRNFGKSEADVASEKLLQDKEDRQKELREKKAEKEREKEKEKRERMEKLNLDTNNFPEIPNKNPFAAIGQPSATGGIKLSDISGNAVAGKN